MIIVFDLDDTLYNEIDFVKSGFKSVARYLQDAYKLDRQETYSAMNQELNQNGRGKIFDVMLREYRIYSKKEVAKCLSVYRLHKPEISLSKEAIDCLERFDNFSKYIVTDGNKIVQKNKIEALRLHKYFKKIFITHNYGKKHAKPSPYCFIKISQIENTKPNNMVYIGDNPNKDFVEIKKLGFKTIRIKKGMFKDSILSKEYEAHETIDSLEQLTVDFLNKLL